MCHWLEGFSNGLLEIKKSPVSGYGAFAVRDLEPFTPVLLERELFNANSFTLYQKLDALTEEQRKAYRTLHGHMRTPSEDIRAAIWRTNRYVQTDLRHRDRISRSLELYFGSSSSSSLGLVSLNKN